MLLTAAESTDVYAYGVLLWEMVRCAALLYVLLYSHCSFLLFIFLPLWLTLRHGEVPYSALQPVECKRQILAGVKLPLPDGSAPSHSPLITRLSAGPACHHGALLGRRTRPAPAVQRSVSLPCHAHPPAITAELQAALAAHRATGAAIRDIGAALNASLTQNLRFASMRASRQRKVRSNCCKFLFLSEPVTLRRPSHCAEHARTERARSHRTAATALTADRRRRFANLNVLRANFLQISHRRFKSLLLIFLKSLFIWKYLFTRADHFSRCELCD